MKASTTQPEPFPLTFFILAFAFSWFFWSFGVLNSLDVLSLPLPNMAWVMIGAHGPLFSSLVLTHRDGGWTAVKALLRAGFRLRMKVVWWISTLVLPVILAAIAVWINASLSDFELNTAALSQPLLIIPMYLFVHFLGGSFQEEFGWRGYALPRMMTRWSPLIASIVLGLLWGVWHTPLFFIDGTSQVFIPYIPYVLATLAFSVVITWMYLKTGRNLFSALLFHTSINASLNLFPPLEMQAGGNQQAFVYLTILYYLVAIVIIALDRNMWLGKTAEATGTP